MNLQEKISKICPSATFEEGEVLCVKVSDSNWHGLAKSLKEDSDLDFDYLVAIIGMDWKETLGCMYYLTSTKSGKQFSVRVETADRENPMLNSISH